MVLFQIMTNTQPQLSTQLSEDVQDILHYAKKAAAKDKSAVVTDRYFLAGLSEINRLFTHLDALLKTAGVPPKKLFQAYKVNQKGFQDYHEPETITAKATQFALEAASKEETPPKKVKVQIEHVLFALSDSPDPCVKAVLSQAGLNREKLEKAIPQVEAKSPLRIVFYCIRETLEVVAVVIFLLIVIKQGFGEFRLIPSESMLPTLHVGDRLAVEKVSHWFRPIHRGDIMVFYPPPPESTLPHDPWNVFLRLTGFSGIVYNKDSRIDTAYIKRVIGLPGDTLEVKPGQGVFIDGHLLKEPYKTGVSQICTFIDYCGPIQVPPHSYFMMGDNRNHSADSRYWGFMPENRVIGRAIFRFYPFDNRMGVFQTPHYSVK